MGSSAWYIGLISGFLLVLAVVICVANILNLARRISVQARELSVALNGTSDNTDVLHLIPSVNEMIGTVYGAVGAVRTNVLERRPS